MSHTISIHLPGRSQHPGVESLIHFQNNLKVIKLLDHEFDDANHSSSEALDENFQITVLHQQTRMVGYDH